MRGSLGRSALATLVTYAVVEDGNVLERSHPCERGVPADCYAYGSYVN
jgi:hypothetical protein